MKEKVSIYIPVFNAEKTIELSLNSIFSQSVVPDEVIVINDSSKLYVVRWLFCAIECFISNYLPSCFVLPDVYINNMLNMIYNIFRIRGLASIEVHINKCFVTFNINGT